MRLALIGQKLGHEVFIVIEQLSEIDVLLKSPTSLGYADRRGSDQAGVGGFRPLGAESGREVQVRAHDVAARPGDRHASASGGASTS